MDPRKLRWGAAVVGAVLALAAACNLNPQPLPPKESGNNVVRCASALAGTRDEQAGKAMIATTDNACTR